MESASGLFVEDWLASVSDALRCWQKQRGKSVMRRFLNRNTVIGFALTLLILSAVTYAAAERESFLRYALFRTAYSIPLTDAWILRQYSNFLDKYNGGYMGERINTFLCSRLESNPSDSEMAAIIEFYGLRAGGREGYRISEISDVAKQRAISLTLQRVDSYDERLVRGSLLIVENMRRGETIFKGGFGPADYRWRQSNFNFKSWWAENGMAEAKGKYKEWWNGNLTWSQKRLIDPLKNSSVELTFIP
jgi:hypothetical protein